MYILWAQCQVGSSYSIVLRPYVHILGPMSGGKVPEYSTGSFVYIPGPMLFGKVLEYSTGVPMYISGSLCQVGRSKSIVLGSNTCIVGHYVRSEGPRVYYTGVLCIYTGSYVRWECPIE